MIVAIDGPSGAGKSSISKIVARELHFSCLDTGAMYRAVAWLALKNNVDLSDEVSLGQIARECVISFEHDEGEPVPKRVFVDGCEITNDIRTAEIDKAVSPVSSAPSVREALVLQQQRIGESGNYVVEGRDIGTVVFPQAEVKIFLTATPEERAHRRVRQNADRCVGSVDYEEVLKDIIRRDEHDSTREMSPLVQAKDAILIDSTDNHIEDVIRKICDLAREKM